MSLQVDQKLNGIELQDFLKESDDIVIFTNGKAIHDDREYKIRSVYEDSSVHQRREHKVLEPKGDGSNLTEVVDYEMDYRHNDYQVRTVYIIE